MRSLHKQPMSQLIRELRDTVRTMELGAAGACFLEVEKEVPLPKRKPRTFSLVWEELPWCDGWQVIDDKTGMKMRSEPFRTERRALEFIDELEAEFGE